MAQTVNWELKDRKAIMSQKDKGTDEMKLVKKMKLSITSLKLQIKQ